MTEPKTPAGRAAEMSPAQFEVVAELLRSREPVRTAVRLVLVEGAATKTAALAAGMQPNAVSNALGRYRNAHRKLIAAYGATC